MSKVSRLLSDTEDIETLAEEYATEFSNPPYFTVGYGVDYDEYLEMQKEVKPQLKEEFQRVVGFLLRNHSVINNTEIRKLFRITLEGYDTAISEHSDIDADTYWTETNMLRRIFGYNFFEEKQ